MLASFGNDFFKAVLQGAPPGTVYALVALGFVLAYKTSGVFNLAFGAQAYVSAVAFFKMHTEWGWPTWLAVLFSVVLLAPLLGVVLDLLIFRHLRTAPPVASLVVAIGLTVALPSIADVLFRFKPKGGQIPEGIAPNGNSVFYDAFGTYSFNRNELVTMVVATAAILGLVALFHFSMIGLQMRAVVESPRMVELNGVPSGRVSAAAWALSSFFAGLAGVLIAPRFPTLAPLEFFNIVVIAVAAAALGSLISLPRAFFGGLGLGITIALFTTFIPKWSKTVSWLRPVQDNITPAIPFVVLFVVLVFVPSVRRSRRATDPLAGVDPPPSSQARVTDDPRRGVVRRLVGLGVVFIAALVLLTRGDSAWLFLVTQAVVLGIVYLSITVMTGFGGHISLCQGAYAAIGAFAVFQLADRYDVSVLGGMFVGAFIAAAIGALLSLPLLRLNGIWVAIATLAFAYFFDSVMVKFSWVGGTKDSGAAGLKVPRPVLGPWDFANDKSFLGLAVVVLAFVAAGVTVFGRSTTGRKLRAVRGSEVAAQSIGISSTRVRVVVFAASAFVAALGGGMFAMLEERVDYGKNFSPFAALFWMVLVVTFGVRTPAGAIIGAASFSLFNKLVLQGTVFGWILRDPDRTLFFPVDLKWQMILFGLGTIQYARHPEGVIEMSRAQTAARRAKRQTRRTTRSQSEAAA